jgi:hypothetical protein
MSPLTIYLARLIGLSAIVLATAFLKRADALVTATLADSPVMLVYALFSVAAGLAIILGHNIWVGGLLSVTVTLVGWLIFAKGLLLLLVSNESWILLLQRLQYGEHYPLYIAPSLLIGLYLTYAGFAAPSQHSKTDRSAAIGG